MRQPASEPPVLPERPSPLGLELKYPLSSLASIKLGCESKNQDEKWSIYFREPWVQIWRPSLAGVYCYAARLEHAEGQRLRVVESWVSSHVLNQEGWPGPDLEYHRGIVTFLLDSVAEYSGDHFEHPLVSGIRHRKKVSFQGEATSLREVEEIAERLRAEVTQTLKDGW
jgi:hypothetical protein